MTAYVAGSAEALECLTQRYCERLERFLARLFPGMDGADLVQETFLRLVSMRASYQSRGNFSGWIYTIARNVAYRAASQQGRSEAFQMPRAQPNDPVEQVGQRELVDALDELIRSMPPADREVLVLSRYEGMDYQQIARITGSTAGAVKVRAFRVLQKLRISLRDYL